jgi:acetoin utilization deacetylase AcuC-like enzyme
LRLPGGAASLRGLKKVTAMLVVHSPDSLRHDPTDYFRRGAMMPHPEQAARYTILHDAVRDAGHELIAATCDALDAILAVHTHEYVEFLRMAWDLKDELPGTGPEILTGHFARPQMHRRPTSLLGLVGYHMADTSTPIREGTWEAILGSAQCAIVAADEARERGHAYALCRPPGHHAYADSAGGFCFLNNTALAAERLRGSLDGNIAILDIDVHHGNGTQGIFSQRSDVLTVSIHADPADYFPYYAGYADERGAGPGDGFNVNMPLAHGSGDDVFLRAIGDALAAVAAYAPAGLVVALGLDASEHDPIGALRVTTEGFARAGGLIAAAGHRTALVQEGGYLCEALPRNLVAFLGAFDAGRR